jgi:methylation protein EvaC
MKKKYYNFLNLGDQPLANFYIKKKNLDKREKKYKLKIRFELNSKLVSIEKTFASKTMFNNEYPYRSSMSKTMQNSFLKLSNKIKKEIMPDKILEIGSNDGSFIKNFNKKKTIGIEPCANVEKITKNKKFNTYPHYWSQDLARKILIKHGKVDLIYSANTISHIKNLDDVFKAINLILSYKGTLIIEDPSLLECLKGNAYDQFYNEHIYVFSYIAIKNLLKKYSLEVYKVENLDIHGGSLRYFIRKTHQVNKLHKSVLIQEKNELKYGLNLSSSYKKFAIRVKSSKKKLVTIFKKCKKNNKKIIGYGATAKSVTVLNYCGIDGSFIDYFLDTTLDKQGKYTPGTKILIKKYSGSIDKDVDYVFLGAWNFKREILKKEMKFIKSGGKFIVHTPIPKIL